MKRMTDKEHQVIMANAVRGIVPRMPSPAHITKARGKLTDKYDDLQAVIRKGQNKAAKARRDMARKLREQK